jgi:hypothetical protein
MISSASPSLKYSCLRIRAQVRERQRGDRCRRVGSSACQVLQGLPDVGIVGNRSRSTALTIR